MIKGILLAVAVFFRVFLLALQTLNVVNMKFMGAFAVSWGLAISDVTFVVISVRLGWRSIVYTGIGGSLGVVSAMWCYGRIF